MLLKSNKKRKFSVYVYKNSNECERVNHLYEAYEEAQKTKKELYTEGAWLNKVFYKEKGYKKAIIINEKENNSLTIKEIIEKHERNKQKKCQEKKL